MDYLSTHFWKAPYYPMEA
ncbi:MAG TPA: hypothetical protein DEQ87_12815 [Algoriphagus sp.]|nr:hypothetical protein [Algoriphagus sp.]HAH37612.1 hypothetical protein [Algoriphagus sp.]HAS60457.1 hypothetical protein [Algoriphagus sp.]HAZ26500.1 hypothetical protein [Algoriphagus sp.]HCB44995.1 hypothetical protein [Algoriphagus sp.]